MIHFVKLFYDFQKSHPWIAYINVSVHENYIMYRKKSLVSYFIYGIDAFRWVPFPKSHSVT